MPLVQKTRSTAELSQRFVEFVLMQAQNAGLFLGQIPHPQTGEPEINLDLARMIIDQLEMIADKTTGNLNEDEAHLLEQTLTSLRLAYVHAASGAGASGSPLADPAFSPGQSPSDSPAASHTTSAEAVPPRSDADDGGSRKKFTKTYGA